MAAACGGLSLQCRGNGRVPPPLAPSPPFSFAAMSMGGRYNPCIKRAICLHKLARENALLAAVGIRAPPSLFPLYPQHQRGLLLLPLPRRMGYRYRIHSHTAPNKKYTSKNMKLRRLIHPRHHLVLLLQHCAFRAAMMWPVVFALLATMNRQEGKVHSMIMRLAATRRTRGRMPAAFYPHQLDGGRPPCCRMRRQQEEVRRGIMKRRS